MKKKKAADVRCIFLTGFALLDGAAFSFTAVIKCLLLSCRAMYSGIFKNKVRMDDPPLTDQVGAVVRDCSV